LSALEKKSSVGRARTLVSIPIGSGSSRRGVGIADPEEPALVRRLHIPWIRSGFRQTESELA
jgi:hypothetical protein